MSSLQVLPVAALVGGALAVLAADLLLRRTGGLVWAVALLAVGAALGLSFLPALAPGPVAGALLGVLIYDAFTVFFWRLILAALAVVLLLSEAYVRRRRLEAPLFYAALLLLGCGGLLLAAAGHLLMLLLALELLSLLGYLLTGFPRGDPRAAEGAIKYLVYGAVLSALMALGISWLYGLSGSGDYAAVAGGLGSIAPQALLPVLAFVLAGLAFKIGAAPFHAWMPDAFAGAPAPVAAALAVVPKLAGFAALTRLTMTAFPATLQLGLWWRRPLLAALAAAAMLIGNLGGLRQTDFKRLLAYSGIAQAGYALIGVALATPRSLSALLVFLTVYTAAELAAFAAIVVLEGDAGGQPSQGPGNLARGGEGAMVRAAMLVAALSLFGLPGTGGFVGKLALFSAALQAERFGLLGLAALGSLLSAFYYGRLIRWGVGEGTGGAGGPVPGGARVAVVLTLAAILALGLAPTPLLRWAEVAVAPLISP